MNTIFKKSVLNIAVASALTVFATSAAMAVDTSSPANTDQVVGGTIEQINETTFSAEDITRTFLAAAAQTDWVLAAGIVNSNLREGWKMTVNSANSGNLHGQHTDSNGDVQKILYADLKFVEVSGDLGSELASPDQVAKNITSGSATWDTGGVDIVADTSTVDYGFKLVASWSADRTLLEGTYTDTLTVSMDSDA